MIELPTRRRLERRRDRLYAYIDSILHSASAVQVENVMRQIHSINLRLRTYFKNKEPQELFIDEFEDNDIATQTSTEKITPTLEDIAKIEEQIKAGEI